MVNEFKEKVLEQLSKNYGQIKKVGKSQSLFFISSIDTIIYFRYSKITKSSSKIEKTFYGLRKEDLDLMKGKKSFICLLTNDKTKDLVIPFQQFENYFLGVEPSNDGQYKTITFFKPQGTELYFANIGKFKVDNFLGISSLFDIKKSRLRS